MVIYSELTMPKVQTKGTLINNTLVNKPQILTILFSKNPVLETKRDAIKTIILSLKEAI
jgi:hypothetical protein